jgi:hypothetical protein
MLEDDIRVIAELSANGLAHLTPYGMRARTTTAKRAEVVPVEYEVTAILERELLLSFDLSRC